MSLALMGFRGNAGIRALHQAIRIPKRWQTSSILSVRISRSETWVPKRGGLKAAGKQQESATFLQCSFLDVAVQFFVCCSAAFGPNDFRTAKKTMLQCSSCSAALRKLQCKFRFRLWHVAGVGFRGVRFRTCRDKWGPLSCTLLRAAWQAHAECTPRVGMADIYDALESLQNSPGETQ